MSFHFFRIQQQVSLSTPGFDTLSRLHTMKKVFSLLLLLMLLTCRILDSKYDPTSPDWVDPSYTIDTTLSTILPNDTITDSTHQLVLVGNEFGNQFRWHIDSTGWSDWTGAGKPSVTVPVTHIDTGAHTLYLQTCYHPSGPAFDSKISFYIASPPFFAGVPDTLLKASKGDTCTFRINAKGTGTLNFRWYFKDDTLQNAINDSLVIPNISAKDTGIYFCKVISKYGEISSPGISLKLKEVPLDTSRSFTSFKLINHAVTGAIDENKKSITVYVPFGTLTDSLTAEFTVTGVLVKIDSIIQISGSTKNNFAKPLTYTVIAEDGHTQNYLITVRVGQDTAKELTSFVFTNPFAKGVINKDSKAVSVTVPYGTVIDSLIATFIIKGASVKVDSTVQENGITKNNFTRPLTYSVIAADRSSCNYLVTVTFAKNPVKKFISFGFSNLDVEGRINESAKTITSIVPFGTDIASLVAEFSIGGSMVMVDSVVQKSGITINDFTKPVIYSVMAEDSTVQNYIITVLIGSNTAKAFTSFGIVNPSVTGIIDENKKTVSVIVPYGTAINSLVAKFTTTGKSVKVDSLLQRSDTTVNNFNTPVKYTVTAVDGSFQDYFVTVSVASNTEKRLTSFIVFTNPLVSGIINDTLGTVSIAVPYGTVTDSLIATFGTTGAFVKVNSTVQISGVTKNNFSQPLTYTVIAADSSEKKYIVTVNKASDTAKALTSFKFADIGAEGAINTIDKSISLKVPYGTKVTTLKATFVTSGSSVRVGTVAQESGMTSVDFTTPVTYTVTAADGSSQNYTVTVHIGPNPAKMLTSFALTNPASTGLINDSLKIVALTVPYGTNVTTLVATFATTGVSVSVGSTTQISGTTANDFSTPVTYTVTAADGSTQNYVVKMSPNAPYRYSVSFNGQNATAGPVPQSIIVTQPDSTVRALPSEPQRTGYRFKGWYTETGGNGIAFTATTLVTRNIEVFARWVQLYSVSYHSNYAPDSLMPDSLMYEHGQTVTVRAQNGLNRPYYTFAGWNTRSDTMGVNYVAGIDTFAMDSVPVQLYAKWRENIPQLTQQITNATRYFKDSITFAIAATGTNLSYRWELNGVVIPGATTSSFRKDTIEFADTGSYRCVVSNAGGNVESSARLAIDTIMDIDGNVYHLVKIGTQIWTVENLRVAKYNDGNPIPNITDNTAWSTLVSPGYCFYNNSIDPAFQKKWGALYNWYTVNTVKLAPVGWHVPSDSEWDILQNYLIAKGYNYDGTTTGNKMAKSMAAAVEWKTSTNSGAIGNVCSQNNGSGFSALPCGYRDNVGLFHGLGDNVHWWSITGTASNASFRKLWSDGSDLIGASVFLPTGFFIRLIKNTTSTPNPPSTPNLTSANAGITFVVPTWQTVTGATSYNLYYQTGTSVYKSTAILISGVHSGDTLKNLTTGTQYSVAVCAVNAGGESPLSNVLITAHLGALRAPRLNNVICGSTYAIVNFDTVYGAASYNLYYQTGTTISKATATRLTARQPGDTIRNLTTNTEYRIAACAVNASGGESDTLSNAIIALPLLVQDADGNTYSTVRIGSQTWTVEDLRTTKYNDGTPILHVTGNTEWINLVTPGYCYYENSANSIEQKKWGALYNWYAVNTGKLAPIGWHVPAYAEWTVLENYLIENGYNYDRTLTGNKVAKAMAAKTDWLDATIVGAIGNDLRNNNTSGFTALPSGYRGLGGSFYYQSITGGWWNAADDNVSGIWNCGLVNERVLLERSGNVNSLFGSYGSSVRLVKNDASTPNPPSAPPTIISALPGNNRITVNFSVVTGATSFNLYYDSNTTFSKSTATLISGVQPGYIINNLTNGRQYSIAVCGVNIGGESPLSNITNATPFNLNLTMVSVPAGTFQRDDKSYNTSTVSAFRMSAYEITRAQFLAVMGTDPSYTSYSNGTSDPVQTVNWYHAIAFCNKLSIAEGRTPVYTVSGVEFTTLAYSAIPTNSNTTWDAATITAGANGYRLPTEMEWMWAAMGAPSDGTYGSTNRTGYQKAFAGNNGSNTIGNCAVFGYYTNETGRTTTERTNPTGSKSANELGLYDMSGNVWEWCWDWYSTYPTGAFTNYMGTASGSFRVVHGGSWGLNAYLNTVAYRGSDYSPYTKGYSIGFRVVCP